MLQCPLQLTSRTLKRGLCVQIMAIGYVMDYAGHLRRARPPPSLAPTAFAQDATATATGPCTRIRPAPAPPRAEAANSLHARLPDAPWMSARADTTHAAQLKHAEQAQEGGH